MSKLNTAGPTEKELKASIKEGGKKGQDLAGMSAMGGVKFFSVAVESATGSWPLMDAVLQGMNKEVDDAAEERKGGAGDIGKCLMFADDDALLILCHVPSQLSSSIDHKEWFDKIISSVNANLIAGRHQDGVLKAYLVADPDNDVFPIKARDVAINASFEYLVSKELVRPDESDDDANYAEMAEIEW